MAASRSTGRPKMLLPTDKRVFSISAPPPPPDEEDVAEADAELARIVAGTPEKPTGNGI